MSTHVVAEYPEEGIALLRDGEGTFIFDRSNSILPIDDEPWIDFDPPRSKWLNLLRKTRTVNFSPGF